MDRCAGALIGTAVSRPGAIILGSWANPGQNGPDVAVWAQDIEVWARAKNPGKALQATPTRLPSAGAVAALADGYVAVGWTTVLGAPVRDEASLWTASSPAGPWRAMPSPTTDASIERPTALACTTDHCAVAGRIGDDVVQWRVRLERGSPTGVSALEMVAADAFAHANPHHRRHRDRGTDTVAYSEGDTTRVVHLRERQDPAGTDLPGRLTAMTTDPRSAVLLATTAGETSRTWRSTTPGR